MRTSVYFILPESGITFSDQLQNCFKQVQNLTGETEGVSKKVVALTFFVGTENQDQYKDFKNSINSSVEKIYGSFCPAVACVAQAPENGNIVGVEVFLEQEEFNNIIYKQLEGIPYVVIEHSNFNEVYVLGLTGFIEGDIYENSNTAFALMEKVLHAENLDFSNVVRQWNYIENITHIPDKNENLQHYQIFNDVRSKFYGKSDFINGYPSATGIGTDNGGVVINFIAISNSPLNEIVPLMNPGQIDAHKYSQKVLVGAGVFEKEEKTCPKFERGKMVKSDEGSKVYISGTAAIVGENTVHPTDVGKQTLTTINNIKNLTKPGNFPDRNDFKSLENVDYSYVRSYVKYNKDIGIVKEICEKQFNSQCFQYLISDICRGNLLVEIEALIEF